RAVVPASRGVAMRPPALHGGARVRQPGHLPRLRHRAAARARPALAGAAARDLSPLPPRAAARPAGALLNADGPPSGAARDQHPTADAVGYFRLFTTIFNCFPARNAGAIDALI